MSVLIKYGDVATGAKEEFEATSEDKAYFVDFDNFKQSFSPLNYTNPCEYYSTLLDGASVALPTQSTSDIGWWSEQIADGSGVFGEPIKFVSTATNLYSSIGITLTFDTFNNVYPRRMNVEWFRYDELISSIEYQPNNATFFCNKAVEYFNKIVITFYEMNAPYARLKVNNIEYGYNVDLTADELKNVSIIQELSPVSTEISINTCDFDLKSKHDVEFSFQDGQSVEVYFNGNLICKHFVKDSKRKSKDQWSVKTEDYIGIMEDVDFAGGVYENVNAVDLLAEIFTTAKVPFEIDSAFSGETVSGYIPYTTCREALMQVAFAIAAVVDTSYRKNVRVFALSDTLTQTVPLNRIMQGQNFTEEGRITSFELAAHKYTPVDEEIVLYRATDSGSGDGIFVRFSEPMHSLFVNNGALLTYADGVNYAEIDIGSDGVLTGKKYEHIRTTQKITNPLLLTTDKEKAVSIMGATLVSNKNLDRLAELCYNYFANTRKVNSKIIERKRKTSGSKYGTKKYGSFKYGRGSSQSYDQSVNVGDLIEVETEYLGNVRGRVVRQNFNLNGYMIVKDTDMR